jgi:uncharacterized protein (DUF1330 family)
MEILAILLLSFYIGICGLFAITGMILVFWYRDFSVESVLVLMLGVLGLIWFISNLKARVSIFFKLLLSSDLLNFIQWAYPKNRLKLISENPVIEKEIFPFESIYFDNYKIIEVSCLGLGTSDKCGMTVEELARRLYRLFPSDIWRLCQQAAGDGRGRGAWFLTRLPLYREVRSLKSFEEFMVRNALAQGAKELLRGEKSDEVETNLIEKAKNADPIELEDIRKAQRVHNALNYCTEVKVYRKQATADKDVERAKKYYELDLESYQDGKAWKLRKKGAVPD